MRMMNGHRILHCFRPLRGGLFRHVQDLVEGQVARGAQIAVVCDEAPTVGTERDRLNRLANFCELGLHEIPIRRSLRWSDVHTALQVRSIARRSGAEILHGHGAKGGFYARFASVASTAAAVTSPHGGVLHFDPSTMAGRAVLAMERRTEYLGNGLVFVCDFESRRYARAIHSPRVATRTVYNGLAPADFLPRCQDEPDFDLLFVGELRELKGVGTLIESVALLGPEGPSLLIVGDGPDEARFRAQAQHSVARDRITFFGPVSSAAEVFHRARLLVIPSHAESFPYIVLEAAAAAKPFLVSEVGGVTEIVGPSSDSLVRPQDPEAMARSIVNDLSNSQASRQRADQLAERVRSTFTVNHMVDQIGEFYADLGDW